MEKSTRQLGSMRTFAGYCNSTTPAVRVLYKLQRTVGAIYLRFLAALRFGAFLAALRFGAFFLAAFFFAAMIVGVSIFFEVINDVDQKFFIKIFFTSL